MKNLSFLIFIVLNIKYLIQGLPSKQKKIDIEHVFKIVALQHHQNNLLYNNERRASCDIECETGG